ncbi:hypothetical protein FAF44_44605 [Nonomuraea sp. MG754425]|uniref:hypothetical protein n=1 Tax=Nonomuraea sp. MG754425 TaxID=2570319 RepID=UPI001F1885FC|nr:hypothetical protein [Nonomuraea sp. MG754425]MCF6475393.1 hypothetical protein [Nonomuraea sp. MG754425]
MRKPLIFTLALAAITAMSACSAANNTAASSPPNLSYAEGKGSLDISVLRTAEYDFPAYETPEALAADRPIVAAGVIDGWQQGPILESGTGTLDYRIVLRMRVTESMKGVKGRESIPENLIFIELSQGAVLSDPAVPADQWKPYKSVSDFEKALPAGTKVLAFPRERPKQEQSIANLGTPLPPGAQLMLVPPQGLILEDPQVSQQQSEGSTALIGGLEPLNVGGAAWLQYKSVQELVSHLRNQGFTE